MPRTAEEKKESQRLASKKYKESHKEKIKSSSAKYNEEHKEERHAYKKSPIGKKKNTISNWKRRGIIDADLSAVYDYYVKQTHCMVCLKEYKNTQDRHLDHNHDITEGDNIRYICCNRCNTSILR